MKKTSKLKTTFLTKDHPKKEDYSKSGDGPKNEGVFKMNTPPKNEENWPKSLKEPFLKHQPYLPWPPGTWLIHMGGGVQRARTFKNIKNLSESSFDHESLHLPPRYI